MVLTRIHTHTITCTLAICPKCVCVVLCDWFAWVFMRRVNSNRFFLISSPLPTPAYEFLKKKQQRKNWDLSQRFGRLAWWFWPNNLFVYKKVMPVFFLLIHIRKKKSHDGKKKNWMCVKKCGYANSGSRSVESFTTPISFSYFSRMSKFPPIHTSFIGQFIYLNGV